MLRRSGRSTVVSNRQVAGRVVRGASRAIGFAGVMSAAMLVAAPASADQLRLQSVTVEIARRTPNASAAELRAISRTGDRHALVQFNRPIDDALRARMAAAGVGLGPPIAGGPEAVIRQTATIRAVAALELLLKAGADINARITDTSTYTGRIARRSSMTERQGQTALFAVAQSGRAEIVRYFLEHGARIDVKDDMGRTPLDAASGNGGGRAGASTEEVRTLLRNAAAKLNVPTAEK